MAFEQYSTQDWKSIPAVPADCDMTSGCFDCNICLDVARDPVVTLCGHLYCWPCIYKWFHFQNSSVDSEEQPRCPVCKAKIFQATMVPLYGRGETSSEAETDPERRTPSLGIIVPPRPPAFDRQCWMYSSNPGQQLPYRNPYQSPQYFSYSDSEEDSSTRSLNLGGNTTMGGVANPVIGVFGEMVYARIFGNSESIYTYPNSYHLVDSSSSLRLRRQERQADKSLSRIFIFLFCGFLLCLFLF